MGMLKHNRQWRYTQFVPAVVCFICAFISITLYSKCSFLFPFNDWDDANCFFTVGKSMMNGLVPYRDLFEQKGPILYFMHGLAWLVSSDTFLGVYFFEVIFASVFLFFSYKTIRLYCSDNCLFCIPFISLMAYGRIGCLSRGDSAEEFCLPALMFAAYIAMRLTKKGTLPSILESIMIGVTAAFVLWVKFNLLGLYLGWIVVVTVFLIKGKQTRWLGRTVLWIAVGVIGLSAIVIVSFAVQGALKELIQMYFLDNILVYGDLQDRTFLGIIKKVFLIFPRVVKSGFSCSPVLLISEFFGLILLFILEGKRDTFTIALLMLGTVLSSFAPPVIYFYYFNVLAVFVFLPLLPACRLLEKFTEHKETFLYKGRYLTLISAFIVICISYLLNGRRSEMTIEKDSLPQFKYAKIINQVENATMINYGDLDCGFYTVANIIPNCKAFCKLNIANPEISWLQDDYVKNQRGDFVVAIGEYPWFNDYYDLVSRDGRYCLYRKKGMDYPDKEIMG